MIEIKVTPERVRNLMSKQGNIRQATTQSAEAFLILHGDQLQTAIEDVIKTFVARKMA